MDRSTSTESTIVRPAKLADAPQLASLAAQLGYPSTGEQVSGRLGDILEDATHAILVAEGQGHRITGYIEVFPFRTIGSDPRMEIASLVVEESCRSQGVGRLLMKHAEQWGRSRGFKEAGLRSNVIRERAHRFYENLGYRVNKTQKSFRKLL